MWDDEVLTSYWPASYHVAYKMSTSLPCLSIPLFCFICSNCFIISLFQFLLTCIPLVTLVDQNNPHQKVNCCVLSLCMSVFIKNLIFTPSPEFAFTSVVSAINLFSSSYHNQPTDHPSSIHSSIEHDLFL